MPRTARKRSASGFYHVVSKGIAGQVLFYTDSDRCKYLDLLEQATTSNCLKLHSYCLMSNHVHLVVEDEKGTLSSAMKQVDERYGTYYAKAIDRRDGVFRKPFWSEPIENDNYLLCAVRYVHANPEAARICRALEYPWSSVDDYLGGPNARGITSTDLVMDMLGSKSGFIEFHQPQNYTGTPFSGSKLRNHLTDEETIALAAGILGHDPRAGTTLEEACLLADHGFPHAHIARITGITATRIRTALSKGYSLGLY